jgi:hypothetical protein
MVRGTTDCLIGMPAIRTSCSLGRLITSQGYTTASNRPITEMPERTNGNFGVKAQPHRRMHRQPAPKT